MYPYVAPSNSGQTPLTTDLNPDRNVKSDPGDSLSGSSGGCCAINKISFVDLIYWKDVRITGAVFFSSFVFLLSLALFSVLSVVAYILLVTLTITLTYRIYKNVIAAVRKTGEGNPFKKYLDLDIGLNDGNSEKMTHFFATYLTYFLEELRNLLLIKDIVDSLQFGVILWLLTYIGSWFNGMTLIIIADVAIFTLPKFYEVYKTEIDHYWNLVQAKFGEGVKMLKQKIEQLELPLKKKLQ